MLPPPPRLQGYLIRTCPQITFGQFVNLKSCSAVSLGGLELRAEKVQRMSNADWSFLGQVLEKGREHSTGVGQVWLTVLFLFRVLVLSTAVESAWSDEQSDFTCNTLQPGCEKVCYDKAFPISHFRYFVLQVIAVSSPVVFYFSYVALHVSWERKREEKEGERRMREAKESDLEARTKEEEKEGVGKPGGVEAWKPPKLKGKLLCMYLLSSVLKLLLEVGFILVLWLIYGFSIPALYVCERSPCPHKVDCFVSRPKEKTIFTLYMQAAAGVSLLLNLLEVCAILWRAAARRSERHYLRQAERLPEGPPPVFSERGYLCLPRGEGTAVPGPEARMGWDTQNPAFEAEPALFVSAPPALAHSGSPHLAQEQELFGREGRNSGAGPLCERGKEQWGGASL
ncbi:hypothetical protein AAFF_G00361960 [Aldrovandia affinis]|uniref:Gap junction protein n=1 Tax=Aldrovandia affinis TaxID=143900 RepID=A0AAD7WN03_9TELE|nr:hypothetical protein AAFF_G00361960 [Aldrovandia affinis]